tara:strand:+ start:150 stop:677 length:528 start_codon:yes stop_codon:yes gene_type:complete
MKKIIFFAVTIFVSYAFFIKNISAEILSASIGVPISHTIADDTVAESDGVSGTFLHAKLPFIPVGLGIESYKTNVKNNASLKIATTMFDIFYLLPIPIINLTLGIGTGNVDIEGGSGFKKGSASQWYTSVGMPILPFFDIHLSYRSVSAKNTKDQNGDKIDLSGNVTGIGIAFTF